MKLTLPRATLVKALDFVARAVERRPTIPILSNVRLEADASGALSLAATDLDMEAKTRVEARVEQAGALTVSATLLHDIARKMADKAEVTLEAQDGGARLSVKSGRARFALQALPVSDWPELAAGDLPCAFRLPAATLARAFAKTAFAISNEETRYYLNGVFLRWTGAGGSQPLADDALHFVSTDGHRLARVEIATPEMSGALAGIIIPRKACAEILRQTKDAEGDVLIEASDAKIRVTIGDSSILSKLIDGSYPDYERVIPKMNDKTAKLPRENTAAATGRVALVSSERGRAVKLEFKTDSLALSVQSQDIGSASEEIEIDYGAGDLTIGFNSGYLAEILNVFDGDHVTCALGESSGPAIFRSPADEDMLVVLMPMRVG